jgi:GGDEF domain-containing protein
LAYPPDASAGCDPRQNVTDRRQCEARMLRLAHFDSLTGLPNRRMLHDRLRRTLRFAEQRGRHIALLFVDVSP